MSIDVVKGAVFYFALVFAAGFVLGPIRVMWAVPRFGERAAELLEMPIMLVVTVLAARWMVYRFGANFSKAEALGSGFVALSLMLVAELTLVLWLRGMTLADYLTGRDPVSGTVYLIMLGIFAVMPWIVTCLFAIRGAGP